MSVEHRAIFERVADVINRQAWDEFGTVFTQDYVEEYPQSGEVIRGLANAIAVRRNYPGGFVAGSVDTSTARLPGSPQWGVTPMFTVVRLEGGDQSATVIFRVRYADGSIWWLTAVYELRGDMIEGATILFAPAFDPPDWREPYREPMKG